MMHFAPTSFSVRHYVAVVVFGIGVLVIGTISYFSLPRESFPDIQVPVIFVTTVQTGANPTDIEVGVTIPIETELEGIEGMKEMRSSSGEDVSVVAVEFYPEVDTQVALQRVRDRVEIAKAELPPDSEEPVVEEFSFTSIPILIYNLVGGDQVARSELLELAEKIEDEIESVRGVLDAELYGGREREIHIEVDPDRLRFFNLPLSQVEAILRGTNENVSAGTSEGETTRIVMRIPGEYRSAGDVFNLPVATTPRGTPVYVRDVAMVRYAFEDEKTRSRTYDFKAADGESSRDTYVEPRRSISIQVKKRTGANIVAITETIDRMLAEYPLPEEVRVIKSLDQSTDVKMMVSDLENGVLTSLILIMAVIFFGLGARNAALVAMAVPFSMLIAIVIIQMLGLTLNMIVLFSLILALGMLVDNAIVIVENIYRCHTLGLSRTQAAIEGTAEMAWPVIASTATTVGAFFPLVFWPGVMGQFMGYLPKTVIIVLLASLFVALVINPTLAALLMQRGGDHGGHDPETERPQYPLVLGYQALLEFMLRRPLWTIMTAAAMLVLVLITYGVFGAGVEFFPEVEPKMVACSIDPPEGISLAESDRLAAQLEARLFGAPGSPYEEPVENLKHATVTVGLAGAGDPGGVTAEGLGPIQIQVEFVKREVRTEPSPETVNAMRRRVEGLASDGSRVAAPLFGAEYDISVPQEGPPTGRPLSVDIFGSDLNRMSEVIRDMKKIIRKTPGAVKPIDTASNAQPTLEWTVDRARAGSLGLDQSSVTKVLQMAVGGLRSGTYDHGDDEQDILIRVPKAYRVDTDRLESITIPTLAGGAVPIASVASAELVPGPVAIDHYNRRRVVNAAADLQPGVKAEASVRAAFQREAAKYPFPPGIDYRFAGAAEEEEAAKDFLNRAFLYAIFIIVIILVLQFNSVVATAIVMSSVVLSLMGVFMGLLVLDAPFGIIMTGIGVISLAGVVVNNAIVLLDAIERLESRGLRTYDAVVSACMIRFRPVILTAVTTILGLVPMALKLNFDFRVLQWQYNTSTSQFWQPMALAVIFGLLVATVLTLGVVPSLYLLYARVRGWFRRELGLGRIDDELAALDA